MKANNIERESNTIAQSEHVAHSIDHLTVLPIEAVAHIFYYLTDQRDRLALGSVNKRVRSLYLKASPDLRFAFLGPLIETEPSCMCNYGCYGSYYDVTYNAEILGVDAPDGLVMKWRTMVASRQADEVTFLNPLKTHGKYTITFKGDEAFCNGAPISPHELAQLSRNEAAAMPLSKKVIGWLGNFVRDWRGTLSVCHAMQYIVEECCVSDDYPDRGNCLAYYYVSLPGLPIMLSTAAIELGMKVVGATVGLSVYGVSKMVESVSVCAHADRNSQAPNETTRLISSSYQSILGEISNDDRPSRLTMDFDDVLEEAGAKLSDQSQVAHLQMSDDEVEIDEYDQRQYLSYQNITL